MRAWVVTGWVLMLLSLGCDAVLKLERAMPRTETKAQPAMELADAGPERSMQDGSTPSCVGLGEDCSGSACCGGATCSPVDRTCVGSCEGPADCESACCKAPSGTSIAICLAASECAPPTAGAGEAGAGGTDGGPACVPEGQRCTGKDDCCNGLCVEYGQGAARCEPQCRSAGDCESGCCRAFANGRACVAAAGCEDDPCSGEASGYRYWCAGDTLIQCHDGRELGAVYCEGGCTRSAADAWDECVGEDPCRNYSRQGEVCGSTLGASADARVLYHCQSQRVTRMLDCKARCLAGDPKQEDRCPPESD